MYLVISFFSIFGATQSFAPTVRFGVRSSSRAASNNKNFEYAILFDCDGVILETEELHRVAYNEAFQEFDLTIDGVPVHWSVCP
jgi:hypothetical protein